jgi:hypothetical protein
MCEHHEEATDYLFRGCTCLVIGTRLGDGLGNDLVTSEAQYQ